MKKEHLNNYQIQMLRKRILPTSLLVLAILVNFAMPVYKNGKYGFDDFLQWVIVIILAISIASLYSYILKYRQAFDDNGIKLNYKIGEIIIPTIPLTAVYAVQITFHIIFSDYPINFIPWLVALLFNVGAVYSLLSYTKVYVYAKKKDSSKR